MFGYIRPYAPELKLREYQYYRAVYCGLCRAMGRCTGQCSRFTLSYDLTFLALCRLALRGGNPTKAEPQRPVRMEKRRCLPHPFRRRLSLEQGIATDETACAAAVLTYQKLLDDRADETGRRRMRARLALPHARRWQARAERRTPGLSKRLTPHMETLSSLEAAGLPTADEPAAAFGEALAALFTYGLEGDGARIAHHLGYHIGRWLYFIDAIDDYEEDRRTGRPNPFLRMYGEEGLTAERRRDLAAALGVELRLAAEALDLLPIDPECCGEELAPLLYHMLQTALPRVAHRVLFPSPDSHFRKKESDHYDGSL